MSESNLISKEISQRKQKVLDHSDYRYLRIVQQNNGGSVTLDANGGQESTFQIPASQVFNLSRSYFRFTEEQAANVGANNFVYRFCDLVPHFQRLTIMTQKGQVIICEIPDCHQYTKAVLRHETRLDEMLGNDSPADDVGIYSGLIPPQNSLISYTDIPGGAASVAGLEGDISAALASIATNGVIRTSGGVAKNGFLEPKYHIRNTTTNTKLKIHNRLPLSLFKNTICAMDKNRYFGDIIEIRVTWSETANIYFCARTTAKSTPVVPPANLDITSLEFHLCTENNPVIVQDMKTKFANGGFVDHIPYLYNSKQTKTGTLQHIELDINRSQGSHIQKILWFPSNVAKDQGVRYYHALGEQYPDGAAASTGATDILDFNPLINGNPIYSSSVKQRVGTAVFNEPYFLQRNRMKGNCITSVDDYNHNFVWYQDWTDPNPFWMKPLDRFDPDVYIDGYPLTEPVKYEIDINFGNAAATRIHYIYAVVLRELTVNQTEIVMR
ncbi:MAG: hypothetical protein BGO27_03570 [Alphaproteobacteria bacterium 33-17]|nr:MAG: hypothetical protein BGO27_03570 [Alphaproteobacteria bacterium 33-17]